MKRFGYSGWIVALAAVALIVVVVWRLTRRRQDR